VFEWAGQVREVTPSKAQSTFMHPDRIEMGMQDVHQRLADADFLKGTDPREFAESAAEIIGDINHVHPFREGNGRTQLEYLWQLGQQAGHEVDLTRLVGERWIEASILANECSYDAMAAQIREAIAPVLERAPSEEEAFFRALNERQDKEREALLESFKAEREAAGPSERKAGNALTAQQDQALQELDKRHEDEHRRYSLEREEARRLKENLEEQRRLEDQTLDKKSQERER
jgi:hypothetical protein